MTPNDFRRIALSFAGAEEKSHMNHPDFRANGRIFATLSHAKMSLGMVKLTPIEQEMFCNSEPEMFVPVPGGWGRMGCTHVILKAAKKASVQRAMDAAWKLATTKKSSKKKS
jgi:hypothetical protein